MKEEDTALSFHEWKAHGFIVLRGSKSRFRDIAGIPQFTARQVVNILRHNPLERQRKESLK
jgi:hypothetical protein